MKKVEGECKCGAGCWLKDANHKLVCCPGCVGIKPGHYRTKDIDKDGNILSEGEQTCGCRQ